VTDPDLIDRLQAEAKEQAGFLNAKAQSRSRLLQRAADRLRQLTARPRSPHRVPPAPDE
jgi:hypothetical protein